MSPLSFLPLMIIFTGGYLMVKLNFFYILHPIRTLKFTFGGNDTRNSIISLLLALAGTLGVGNIVGVAYGIYRGGPGSVFWLALSALFSSAIKYAEVSLSAKHNTGYGIISVIDGGSPNFLSKLYATLALLLSFAMGSLLQAEAISESISAFRTLRIVIIPIVFIFTASVCLLGKAQIKKAVAIVIPAATLLYTGMCLCVIVCEFERIPRVLEAIISSAFNFSALRGGILAFIISSGIKEGFARGLLSNEAGAGTSSFSHTSHTKSSTPCITDEDYAKRAGIYGIIEVIFDTLLLCPLTAMVVLMADNSGNFMGTVSEIAKIFETYLGGFAPFLLFMAVTAFAVSTTLCWYYYGKVSLSYLTRGRYTSVFSALFIFSFAIGLIFKIDILIYINDIILFLLSIITLYTIIKNRASLGKPR